MVEMGGGMSLDYYLRTTLSTFRGGNSKGSFFGKEKYVKRVIFFIYSYEKSHPINVIAKVLTKVQIELLTVIFTQQ